MNFVAIESNPCIFTRECDMICLYFGACIILSRTKEDIDTILKELHHRKYALTDKGTMEKYLGIMITHNDDGLYRMSQPFLIDHII